MTRYLKNLATTLWVVCLLSVTGGLQAAPSLAPQLGQSSTQLPDGRWLLVGTSGGERQVGSQIQVLDSVTGRIRPAGISLNRARNGHTATLMPDGRILVLGGTGVTGVFVTDAEVIDLAASTVFQAGNLGLLPRSQHTATLLADGRILIAGGIGAKGQPLAEVELINTADLQVEAFNGRTEVARLHHLAQLLPTDAVLMSGGQAADGKPVSFAELFDVGSRRLSRAGAEVLPLQQSLQGADAPTVTGSRPADGASAVPVDSRITVRLSKWMRPETLTAQVVSLSCAGDTLPANVVPAERGLLLFVTPRQSLPFAADCRLSITGGQDMQGTRLAITELRFRTAVQGAGSADGVASTAVVTSSPATASSVASAKPSPSAATTSVPAQGALNDGFRLPMVFEPNRGQFESPIKFGSRGRGYRLHITSKETLLNVVVTEPKAAGTASAGPSGMMRLGMPNLALRKGALEGAPDVKRYRLRLETIDASAEAGLVGLEPQDSKTHYVDTRRSDRRIADVPHYGKLLQTGVYPGVDKLYYGKDGQLEYDWIVKPGANPAIIAQKITGADSVTVTPAGDLAILVGGRQLTQKKPVAFQTIDGTKTPVVVDYLLAGDTVRLKVGNYNKSHPLTIDPVIEFATYLGSLSNANGQLVSMQLGSDESVFLLANGTQVPSTAMVSLSGAKSLQDADTYLIKVRPGGKSLEYVTVLVNYSPYLSFDGSSATYEALAVRDSASGPQAILSGFNFDTGETVTNVVVGVASSGDALAFVEETSISYAPPVGFGGTLIAGPVAVDNTGAIYVVNGGANPSLGGTINAFWSLDPGTYSQFVGCTVVKLSPDAANVLYQSFIRLPTCWNPKLRVDSTGSPYVVAQSELPITPTNPPLPEQAVLPIPVGDFMAYTLVAKFAPSGSALQYAAYLYTAVDGVNVPYDKVWDVGLDGSNNLYALGNWSVTKYSPAGNIVYATKVSPAGSALNSTLGVSSSGEAHLATFIPDSVGVIIRLGTVVHKLTASGAEDGDPFVFHAFPGGAIKGQRIRPGSGGSAYIAGVTTTPFAGVKDAIQPSFAASGPDLFLAKLGYGTLLVSSPNPSQSGDTVTLSLTNLPLGASGWTAFYDNSVLLGSSEVIAGKATYATAALTAGTHALAARFNGITYTAAQVVKLAAYPTTTTLTATPATVSENDPVVLQIQVTGSGPIPGGAVNLMEGPIQRGSVTLGAAGTATVSLPLQAKGSHDYTALYAGDSSHAASTSGNAAVLVTENPVAIAITSPANGSTLSVPGVIPLAVTAVPGSQTTIKNVAYSANGTLIGTSTEAPFGFSWGLLTPGSYTLTATSTTDTGQTATSAPITVTAVGTPGAGLVTYFHQDLTGNTIAATDGAGNLIYRENYRPYGERLVKDTASEIGNVGGNRQWFHGKVEDANTGLQYFGARYYDPVVGRFMGVDAAGVDPGNLHSGNRYAYGNNNPYRFRDPDGNTPIDVLFLAYDVAKLGVAVYSGVGVGAALVDVGLSAAGVLSPVPGTGQFLKGMRTVEHAVEAVRTAEKVSDVGKTARVTGDALKAVRSEFENVAKPAFWKKEATLNGEKHTAENIARMEKGKPPIGKDGHPMELHHKTPLGKGGSNDVGNLTPMTRTEHRLGENYKLNHSE